MAEIKMNGKKLKGELHKTSEKSITTTTNAVTDRSNLIEPKEKFMWYYLTIPYTPY